MEFTTLKEQLAHSGEQVKVVEDQREAAVGEVERSMSQGVTEQVTLTSAFDEHAALANSDKTEIAPPTTPIEALKERHANGGSEVSVVDDHRDAAARDGERALFEKEAELVK
jgi:hypothetical protein